MSKYLKAPTAFNIIWFLFVYLYGEWFAREVMCHFAFSVVLASCIDWRAVVELDERNKK